MNTKRIIQSTLMLMAVAGMTAAGTGAFFSDTETSAGNVFTAGNIDLLINHTAASYNGEDCTTSCDPWAVNVESFTQGTLRDGGAITDASRSSSSDALGPAQTTGVQNDPSPTGFVSLGFGGQIVLHFPNGIDDGPGDDIRIYEATGGNNYPAETVEVEVSPDGLDWTTIIVIPDMVSYDGTVEIDLNGVSVARYVRLTDVSDPADFSTRPTADGYDLDAVQAIHCDDAQTDGVASDIWQCQLWESTDLTNESFFNFSDIKPQDEGTNLISMTVESNESYLCLDVANGENAENSHLDTEVTAGDLTDDQGEMGDFLQVAGWYSDSNGDVASLLFGPTNVNDLGSIAYSDSNVGSPAQPGQTEYVELAWCMGEMTANDSGYTCDGAVPDINQTQTDAFLADLQFFAIQTRNNEGYTCGMPLPGDGGGA